MARLPIPWDWDGTSWKCWAVSWPDSPLWNAILWGFITTPTRGWFWDERTGSVTDTQQIGQEINNRNDPLEEVILSCSSDALLLLQELINQLADIANKPCCPSGGVSGSRGAGQVGASPNPYDQAETPETPPPGFSTMEEFESHKCNAAEDLLNNLKSDLIGLSGITYAGSTPTGIVGTLIVFFLTPIPFDDLIALAAYLIYSAYSYTFLAQMSAAIGENQDELRCILFDADSAESAKANLLAELQEIALAEFTTSGDAGFVMGAIEYMLGYDATNVLFENVPTVAQSADCSECGSSTAIWAINPGICAATVTDGSFQAGQATSVDNCQGIFFGTLRAGMAFGSNPDSEQERHVAFSTVNGGGNYYVTIVNDANPAPGLSEPYTAAALAALSVDAYQIQITRLDASDVTPFDVVLTVTVI